MGRLLQDKKQEAGSLCMRQMKKEKIGKKMRRKATMKITGRCMPSTREPTRENILMGSTKVGTLEGPIKQSTTQGPAILTTPVTCMKMFTKQCLFSLIFQLFHTDMLCTVD